jgi:hypothetical protein
MCNLFVSSCVYRGSTVYVQTVNSNPMKNLLTVLIFTCLGIACLGVPDAQAQDNPSPANISSGTYAIIHHPDSGSVLLVDLFAAETQKRTIANHQGSKAQVPAAVSRAEHATLAYDGLRGQLVYAARSSKGAAVWAHRVSAPAAEQIGEIPIPPGHIITKMAAGPDGHIYALTTPVSGGSGSTDRRSRLVRITPGQKGHPASTRTVAVLSGSNGFHAALIYSGDMAFSAAGDLYIFATAIDTTIRYYTGAELFRIQSTALRSAAGTNIQVERLGPIRGIGAVPGFDSTVISGAAFLPDGRFLLSAMDKATQQTASLFVGRFLPDGIFVEPVTGRPGAILPGFLVADLASRHFPSLPPIRKTPSVSSVRQKPATQPDDWAQYVTIRTFQY